MGNKGQWEALEMKFVERIRGARNVLTYTPGDLISLVKAKAGSHGFTLQEYFKGTDIGTVFYDWDAKYNEDPGDDIRSSQKDEFVGTVTVLHPGKRVVLASRHGWVVDRGAGAGAAKKHDDKGTAPGRKYKISYRAWVPDVNARLLDIPLHARAVFDRDLPQNLDLSVYKGKEQLLGIPYGAKDTDSEKRFLMPMDEHGEFIDAREITWEVLKDYIVQATEEGAEMLKVKGGVVRTGKGKKAEGSSSTTQGSGRNEENGKETFTRDDDAAGLALKDATDFFGDRYRMQEKLMKIHANRKERNLVFPTEKRWCFLKRETHASNNPYITVTEVGARFKCPDEDCKEKGDLPRIPLTELPASVRTFFYKVCYDHVDGDLMSEAKVEAKKNIIDHFPEEDDLDVAPVKDMLTALAKHQKCKKCHGGRMQFEHTLRGWNLRCNDCSQPWPRHPVPMPQEDFPKLFSVLTQLNFHITVNMDNSTTVNNYNMAQVDETFVGTYDEDGLVVFEDEGKNLSLLNALQGTDASLSGFVFTLFHDEFHCCKTGAKGTEGAWYQYRDHHWAPKAELTLRKRLCMDEFFLKYIRRALMFYERECIQTEDTKRKARHIKRVLEQIGDGGRRRRILEDAIELFHEYRPKFSDMIDTQNLLVFTNGVLDLNSFEFRDGRPEDFMSIQLKIPYQPADMMSEKCAFVMDFMTAIQPDLATRNYLLKVLSLCITTEVKMQYFWIFTGGGANGKSKLMNFLMELLGDYFGTAPAALLTRRREDANQANESLSALEKARVAVFSEGSSSEVLQVNTIKLFSGEDLISTRGLHEKQRRWKPCFKCILVCNDIPTLDENSWAAWRRIKVVHFPTSFVDEPIRPHERQKDPLVGEKLSECADAFAAVLVEYLRRFKAEGLAEPPAVTEATRKYQSDNDVFAEFKEEYIMEEKGRVMSWSATWPVFQTWMKRRNPGAKLTKTSAKALFDKNLEGRYDTHRDKVTGETPLGWKGYRLLER